eukprot:m.133732 g.133732  ORF g.133732 m.133732 type:complete len:186 (+) comp15953_c0_seq49:561-1118(+)
MREYVTRQSRDAVQQFANFLTLHSEEVRYFTCTICQVLPYSLSLSPQSPLFAVVQSLLVSNELLQVIFNLDTLLTTPDGCTFFHRQLEHLVKRVGGSAVPISRLYSAHPRRYQQAVREALQRGLTCVGYGLNAGTYKPCLLEHGQVATGTFTVLGGLQCSYCCLQAPSSLISLRTLLLPLLQPPF